MAKKAEPKFKINETISGRMVDGKMMSFVEKRLDKVTLPKSFDGVLVIPQEVTQIGRYACKGLKQIKEVILPDNLVYFGIEAFADCENLEKKHFQQPFDLWTKVALPTAPHSLNCIFLPL